ncbi:hypothetical protein FKM82_019059 [Ascaphus truei]
MFYSVLVFLFVACSFIDMVANHAHIMGMVCNCTNVRKQGFHNPSLPAPKAVTSTPSPSQRYPRRRHAPFQLTDTRGCHICRYARGTSLHYARSQL